MVIKEAYIAIISNKYTQIYQPPLTLNVSRGVLMSKQRRLGKMKNLYLLILAIFFLIVLAYILAPEFSLSVVWVIALIVFFCSSNG